MKQARRGRQNRDFVLDWRWGLSGQWDGDEEQKQIAHERLRSVGGFDYYPAQNEAAQTLSPGPLG